MAIATQRQRLIAAQREKNEKTIATQRERKTKRKMAIATQRQRLQHNDRKQQRKQKGDCGDCDTTPKSGCCTTKRKMAIATQRQGAIATQLAHTAIYINRRVAASDPPTTWMGNLYIYMYTCAWRREPTHTQSHRTRTVELYHTCTCARRHLGAVVGNHNTR